MAEASRKTKNKLIGSFLSLVFCIILTVAVSGAYGWYCNNKEVTANGMSISLKATDGININEYYIYKRSGSDEGAKNVTDRESIVMSEYDTVFTDRNVNTPIIIKAVISSYPEDYSPFYINVQAGDTFLDENNLLYNSLSNIISIGAIVGNSTIDSLDEDADSEAIYNSATSSITDMYSFVSYTKQTDDITIGTKTTNLNLYMDDYSEANITNGKLSLYIMLNYNDDLILKYLNQHEIVVSASEDFSDEIEFDCDITSFLFTLSEHGGNE